MPVEQRTAVLRDPGFGKVFTDHMLVMHYCADKGWRDGEIKARGPFQIDPACAVLHYAQEIFEGMKAYRTSDGGAALFRADANARCFRLREAFACGTAAVITPIGQVRSTDFVFSIGSGQPGDVTARLRSAIVEIQQEQAADSHGWCQRI